MEFTEYLQGKLTLALKSGLLCAVTLVPMTALAEVQELVSSDELNPPAITVEQNAAIATNKAATSANNAASAERRKENRLSGHIQRKYRVSPTRADRIVQSAMRNAKQHKLDPELILALIAVESTFKERAVSRMGARGLMQVMPHADHVNTIGGAHHLFDPSKNIEAGSRILVRYLNTHSGNMRRALLSYNGSSSSRSSFPERVMRVYRDFRRVTVEG